MPIAERNIVAIALTMVDDHTRLLDVDYHQTYIVCYAALLRPHYALYPVRQFVRPFVRPSHANR